MSTESLAQMILDKKLRAEPCRCCVGNERERRPYTAAYIYLHRDVLQHLLGHSVGTVELKEDVRLEDVLDEDHMVFGALLCKTNRLCRLEWSPQVGQFWDLCQRCGVLFLNLHTSMLGLPALTSHSIL